MKMTRRNYLKTSLGGISLLACAGDTRALALSLSAPPVPALSYSPGQSFSMKPEQSVPPDEVRMLGGYIHNYTAPDGLMDMNGGWTAIFDMLDFTSVENSPISNSMIGQVAVSRLRGSVEYIIRMDFRPTKDVENVTAMVNCNNDALASLSNYELCWSCSSTVPITYTRTEAGLVQPGTLQIASGSGTDSFVLSRPLTCLWTLFDAVRHMPAQAGWSHSFDLFMDLSSMRRNQQLRFRGKGSALTAAGILPLSFYEQIGEGIVPIHYAVDERQRTLFVTQGQLGWGLNRIERF